MEEEMSLVTWFSSCCDRVHNFILEVYSVNKVYHISNGLQNITLFLIPLFLILQVSSTLAYLAFPTPSHALQTALCDSASLLLTTPPVGYLPFCVQALIWHSLVFQGLRPSQHITSHPHSSSVPSHLVGYKVFIPHDHLSNSTCWKFGLNAISLTSCVPSHCTLVV